MSLKRFRFGKLIPIVAVLAIVAAACSSSKSSTASSSSSSQAQGPATTGAPSVPCTGTPVKLMGIEDATGPIPHPQTIAGVKAGIFAANKNCTAGRPLSYTVCDDQGNANSGEACAREAVSGGYTAVIDTSTATSTAWEPILAAAKIPIVGGVASASSDYTYPYGFFLSFPLVTIMAQLKIAAALKATTFTFAAVDLPNVRGLVTAEAAAAKALGLTLASPVYIPPTATDYASYAAQIKSSGAQAVVFILGEQGENQLLNAMHQAGIDITKLHVITTTQVLDDVDLQKLGPAAEGALLASAAWPTDDTTNPGIKAYEDGLTAAGISDPIKGDYGVMAWDTIKLLAPILKGLPTVTPAALISALEQTGPTSYPEFHPFDLTHTAFPDSPALSKLRIWSQDVIIGEVKGGVIVPISGFESVANPITLNVK